MQAKTEEINKVDEKAKAYFFEHVVSDFEGALSEEEINEISQGVSADQEVNWPYIATLQAIADAAKINETNEKHIKNLIKKSKQLSTTGRNSPNASYRKNGRKNRM